MKAGTAVVVVVGGTEVVVTVVLVLVLVLAAGVALVPVLHPAATVATSKSDPIHPLRGR